MSERATLPRLLGFKDLVYLTVGGVIGSGIFIVPASVLQLTGGQLAPALLVWIAAGVLSTLGAFTYAELGAMKPECGGLYIYIRDTFGGFVAFLYGWALFIVISSATNATLAVAFAAYLGELLPLSPWAARGVAVGMIVAITVINVIGTRQSADVQNWTTMLKVAAILLMSVLLLAKGDGLATASVAPFSMNVSLLAAMGAAMIPVLWAYEGWHYVTFSAGEVIEPQRNFARGIIMGTAALIVIYVLANLAYVAALGTARGAQSPRIAADAVATMFGGGAGKLIAVAILISMFSAANATALTATRVYYAMARDGVFFDKMAEVHPRWNTPAFAIVVSSIWSAVLAVTGKFEDLLTYVVFAGWIFYGLGAAAVFYYRRSDPHAPRPFRVPGYPVTPILFMLASGVVVVNTLFVSPREALFGVALILLGAPAYWFWHRKRSAVPVT
jgi:basic amino acid/polyamine antiporter, APA family